TITDVRVTGDLQHASVFYTVYGTDEERADSAAALKAATGMLRTEVGRNLSLRLTPSLEFIADAIPENAAAIDALLREASEPDNKVSALAANDQYAGDEDPYDKPREFEDDDEDSDSDLRHPRRQIVVGDRAYHAAGNADGDRHRRDVAAHDAACPDHRA